MCGLIGYSGPKNPNLFKLCHIMADNDSRGGHSTGMLLNNQLAKSTGKSSNLLLSMDKHKSVNSRIAIAHTRYATHGKQTADNAHPYKYGKIIGAHNGVLSNYEEVCTKFDLNKPDVDSKAIFMLLNKTKNYKNLGLFDGTIAVIFTDGEDSLYVYRRNNPLFKCETDEGVYFSSLSTSFDNIKGNVTEVPANKLFRYVKGKIVSTIKIKHKPVPATKIVNTDWSSYGKTDWSYPTYKGYGKATNKTVTKAKPDHNISYNNYWYDEIEDTSPANLSEMRETIEDIVWSYRNHLTDRELFVLEETQSLLQDEIVFSENTIDKDKHAVKQIDDSNEELPF